MTITQDDQFGVIHFSYLMINKIYCPFSYPYNAQSRTSPWNYECFDQCYENQYVVYNNDTKNLDCMNCTDVNCKLCEAASQCS